MQNQQNHDPLFKLIMQHQGFNLTIRSTDLNYMIYVTSLVYFALRAIKQKVTMYIQYITR